MLVLFLFGALCVLLPLTGAAFAATPLAPYLAFPPRTEQVPQPSFSWNAALLVAAGLLAVVGVYGFALSRTKKQAHSRQTRPFPRWGWYGVALIVAGMLLGWSRGIVDPYEGAHVVGHALEDEAMEAIARPGITIAQGFQDDERGG